jgi:uncharacterized phage infection (PIP) family protein YhgE
LTPAITRWFAVVADEVRNLAQRCAQAAKETAGKIEGAIAKSGQGVELTGKVAQGLSEIVAKIRQVDELAAEAVSGAQEQAQGIGQINAAVGQMDKVTQNNAATAEESAAAAQELNAQSELMKGSVAELLELVGASGQAAASRPVIRNRETSRVHTPNLGATRLLPSVHANGNGNGQHAAQAKKDRSTVPMEADFKDF